MPTATFREEEYGLFVDVDGEQFLGVDGDGNIHVNEGWSVAPKADPYFYFLRSHLYLAFKGNHIFVGHVKSRDALDWIEKANDRIKRAKQ